MRTSLQEVQARDGVLLEKSFEADCLALQGFDPVACVLGERELALEDETVVSRL